jgi:hypothetical protein
MNDNVMPFGAIQGGKQDTEQKLPQNNYVLEDVNGDAYPATGFLIFTTQHVAVMKDTKDGAIPVLVMPLTLLKVAELVEEYVGDDEEELPF